MPLLKDWFGWEGPYTAGQRRTEESHQAKMKETAELLKTREGQLLLTKANTTLREAQADYYNRRGGTATDPLKRAGDIAGAVSKMDNAGFFDDNDELKESLTAYALKDLPGADSKKPMDTDVDIAGLLTGNLADIPQKTKRKWYDDTISEGARNDAVKKSVNELVRKHGYSQEQATSVVQDEINSKMGKEKGKTFTTLPESSVDVRGLFSEGIDPFNAPKDWQKQGMLTPEMRTDLTGEGITPFEDNYQAGTETVPEENIPQTYEQLGIEQADQESFQLLEAKLPDIDLRKAYKFDPAKFQMILKALRSGKAPNGKPFTIKDAIRMFQGG